MTDNNSTNLSNISLSSKEGLLITTQSIAAQIQAQVDNLLPQQVARQQGNIFFFTISRIADIFKGTNPSEMANLVDAMGTLRRGVTSVSPGIIQTKESNPTNIIPLQIQTKPTELVNKPAA